MVVNNFNVERVPRLPPKADSPLIVDTNTVLSGSLSPEPLQAVRRRHAQILKGSSPMEHPKFAQGNLLDISRQLLRSLDRNR
jgi:hypothetical protein